MQKYAIPCIISLLVGALYNIVDQIFIANASYLGSLRKRGQHRCVPAYGGGAGHCRPEHLPCCTGAGAWRSLAGLVLLFSPSSSLL